MKKYSKIDYVFNILITLFILFIAVIITRTTYIYGSRLDWESQHYYIPDYLRKQFYATGNIIPEFAANIGAGQNAYNFLYYGILNPIILISYLLPFVSMRTYISVSSILIVIASGWLFYRWIFKKYGTRVAFFSTVLFICASPLLVHSHRHIMFINYMPFLILALFGVDRYFEKKRRLLLIVSVALIIFTSYFFSVGAIFAITIYAIGTYLGKEKKVTVKSFLIEALKYAINIICSVMMAGVILLPAVFTMISGREKSNVSIDFEELLIPQFHDEFVLYGTYSMGLTGIFIISLMFGAFASEIKNKFISICFIIGLYVSVFVYALNGTMYVDGKVLIPFIPVGCYITASMLYRFITHDYDFKKLVKIVIIGQIPIVLTFHDKITWFYLLDVAIAMAGIVYFNSTSKFKYFAFNTMAISVGICIGANFKDSLVEKSSVYITSEDKQKDSVNYIVNDMDEYSRTGNTISTVQTMNCVYDMGQYSTTVYSSIYNRVYNNFFYNEMKNENPYRNSAIMSQPKNVLFNLYMGTKYLIGEDLDIKGYNKVYDNGVASVYKNEYANSLGYINYKTLNTKAYEKLSYPENVLALYSMTVTDESDCYEADVPKIHEINLDSLEAYDKEGIVNKISDGQYFIDNKKDSDVDSRQNVCVSIPVPEEYRDSLLFVTMDVDNTEYSRKNNGKYKSYSEKDVIIQINGISNKLTNPDWKYYNNNSTFEYTISSQNSIDTLEILFYDGVYEISNIKVYAVNYDELVSFTDDFDKFVVKKQDKAISNVIEGDILALKAGILNISIPYDSGFEITVDGEKTDYYMVDKGFIGINVNEGEHHVVITYHAPLLLKGKIMSLSGLVLLIILLIVDMKIRRSDNANSISDSAML